MNIQKFIEDNHKSLSYALRPVLVSTKEYVVLLSLLAYKEEFNEPTSFLDEDELEYFKIKHKNIIKFAKSLHKGLIKLTEDSISNYITKFEKLKFIKTVHQTYTRGNVPCSMVGIHINYNEIYKYFIINYRVPLNKLEYRKMLRTYLNNPVEFMNTYVPNMSDDVFQDSAYSDIISKYCETKRSTNSPTNKETIDKIYKKISDLSNSIIAPPKACPYTRIDDMKFFYLPYEYFVNETNNKVEIEQILQYLVDENKLVRNFQNRYCLASLYSTILIDNEDLDDFETNMEEFHSFLAQFRKENNIQEMKEVSTVRVVQEPKEPSEPKQRERVKQYTEAKVKTKITAGKKHVDRYLEESERDVSETVYKKMIEFAEYLSEKRQLTYQSIFYNFESLFNSQLPNNDESYIDVINKTILRGYHTFLYVLQDMGKYVPYKDKSIIELNKKNTINPGEEYGMSKQDFDEWVEHIKQFKTFDELAAYARTLYDKFPKLRELYG